MSAVHDLLRRIILLLDMATDGEPWPGSVWVGPIWWTEAD